MRYSTSCHLLATLLLILPGAAAAQTRDSTLPGPFDLGKMWTFENPPAEYFSRTYGFAADSAWFARARLAALRIPGCSAGLVSPNGLIVTNHHCVRGRLPSVARPGETLLDSGFVARDLADERQIPGYFADQLLAALDVSEELDAAGTNRAAAADQIAARLKASHGAAGDSIWVQLVPLYDGARTSAYVFRRLTDIRFVAAVELQMGFFGGDPDNFTYPRYALDFAVLRAYGRDGKPLATPAHFGWGGGNGTGVQPDDVVFVIGNPGRTARLTTMSQLEYLRDVGVPVSLSFHRTRLDAMKAYHQAEPAEAEAMDIRNRMFSLSNREKSLGGRFLALHDPTIMARRGHSEQQLKDSLRARPALGQRYGGLFDALARVQQARRAHEQATAAFSEILNRTAGSGVLHRAFWAWRATSGPADSTAIFERAYTQSPSWPAGLERRFLALQLADIVNGYGADHAISRAVLGNGAAQAAAERLLAGSQLAAATPPPAAAVAADPAVLLMQTLGPAILEYQRAEARLAGEEGVLAANIGRARYAVYGAAIPPDGSSSPRIADGVVQGYSYNGTLAPPWTTFYGIYDRYAAFGPGTDWDLPYRWRTPPAGLDLGTPLNFVSTADSYGGNSGSPAVTRELRLVGLNFDRNINALVRDYLFLPERGRNVMVDARAIEAALDVAYDLDRVVLELRTGRLVATEAEADRIP